ncbi:MAG: hypothetical protein ACI8RZ_003207 [Myxococcota bacterium]|jgi:hypothetical protein
MLLLLVSCSGSNFDTTQHQTDDTAIEPAEWPTESASDPVAQLTPEQLSDGITAVLDVIFRIDPESLHQAQNSSTDEMEGNCPFTSNTTDTTIWYGQCETKSGAVFSGSVDYANLSAYTEGRYAYSEYALWIGSASVSYTDGNSLWAAGRSEEYIRQHSETGTKESYHQIYGNFTWSHPSAEGSWLAEDYGMVIVLEGQEYTTGGTAVMLNGSMSGVGGDASVWQVSDFLLYDSDVDGVASSCTLEPSGVISAQDADGHWYDVYFQGPGTTDVSSFPPECDGCGQLYFNDALLGEVCPDFSSVLSWSDAPWK